MRLKKAKSYTRIVTYMMFFVIGSGMSVWGILIPYTKARLALDESQLGSLLMLIGIGAMLAMAFAGRIVAQIGARKTIIFSSFLMILALFCVNLISDVALLCIVLVLLGVGVGTADVGLNIQAVFVEKAQEKKLMSGFHSMYSGGSFVCGIIAGKLLSSGLSIDFVLGLALASFMLILLLSFKGLSPQKGEKSEAKFATPSPLLWICGVVCFVAYMSEGAFLDWSAVFLIREKAVAIEESSYGFALFFGAITIGRLCGDYFAARFSSALLLTISAFIAASGLLIFIFAPHIYLVGAIVAGLGASNIIPFIVSAIPRIKGQMSLNSAIAAVTTLGYSGTLLGPALIGYVAHYTSLVFALCGIAGLLFMVSLVVRKLK